MNLPVFLYTFFRPLPSSLKFYMVFSNFSLYRWLLSFRGLFSFSFLRKEGIYISLKLLLLILTLTRLSNNISLIFFNLWPIALWYFFSKSFGKLRKCRGSAWTTSSSQNNLIFFTKFWYRWLIPSNMIRKFLSTSSRDLRYWRSKNSSYLARSGFFSSKLRFLLGTESSLTLDI